MTEPPPGLQVAYARYFVKLVNGETLYEIGPPKLMTDHGMEEGLKNKIGAGKPRSSHHMIGVENRLIAVATEHILYHGYELVPNPNGPQ